MAQGTLRVLRFVVGSQQYCVRIEHVLGIRNRERLQANPEPLGPLGWLLDDRDEIPIYDVPGLLGDPRAGQANRAQADVIIALEASDGSFGLLADRVFPVRTVGSAEVVTMPHLAQPHSRSAFKNVALIEDRPYPLLVPDDVHPGRPRFPLDIDAVSIPPAAASRQNRRHQVLVSPLGTGSKNGLSIGFSLRQVAEILAPRPCQSVPGTPSHFVGLMAWRQTAIPLIEPSSLVGLDEISDPRRVLVARGVSGEYAGIRLQQNPDVLDFPFEARQVDWEGDSNADGWLLGYYETLIGRVAMIDVDGLLRGVSSRIQVNVSSDTASSVHEEL